MSDFSNSVHNHQNKIQSISGTLASVGIANSKHVTKLQKGVAGIVLTPVTWAYNNAVDGRTPGAVDVGLYGAGLAGGPVGIAAAIVGTFKSFIDDATVQQLKQAAMDEDSAHRPYLRACANYGFSGQTINAQRIAAAGGTAWLHKNGLWVYIVSPKKNEKGEIEELMVMDFKPKGAVEIYQPKQPLQKNLHGQLTWGVTRS